MEELEVKINSLNSRVSNATFVATLKAAIEEVNHLEVSLAEERIIAKILPLIHTRCTQAFADNAAFALNINDYSICALIKENLEVVFHLAEIVQEIMIYIHDHSPVQLLSIESVFKYLPILIQMSAGHWKNSADDYNTAFHEQLAKLFEVLKHLYACYLYLLERSIQVEGNEQEISLLVNALVVLCEMPQIFSAIDASSILSSWNCFLTVTCNYSSLIENDLDVRVPIQRLADDICQMLRSSNPQEVEAFQRQLKILTYLAKVLCKITYNFTHQLSKFAPEVLKFFVKFYCCLSDVHANKAFSLEITQRIDAEVVKLLESLMRALLVTESGTLKEQLKGFSRLGGKLHESSRGYLALLGKILQMISNISADWSGVLPQMIADVFQFLANCKGKMYQNLIVQMGLAILVQDRTFECSQVLLRHILQENGFEAVLALEVYCLVASNISPEECLALLLNLLNAVQELHCGFFTNRPEICYLKCLVQRLYAILPGRVKEEVVRLFRPEQHIQVWRFLEFASFPQKSRDLLVPIVEVTADYIQSFTNGIDENMLVNVGESIDLLSTVDNLALISTKASVIVGFLSQFWDCGIDNDTSSNNLLKYMLWKVSRITASCIGQGRLKPSWFRVRLQQSENSTITKNKTPGSALAIGKKNFIKLVAEELCLRIKGAMQTNYYPL